MYYDKDLPTSQSLTPVTVAAWKSYPAKAKNREYFVGRGPGTGPWSWILAVAPIPLIGGLTWQPSRTSLAVIIQPVAIYIRS